eukprot:scaffold20478_cov149-Isochrysis_galbana.AAC.1
MAAASPEADATSLSELGLPSWLDSMLQPGVGNGVFITLKASLVGLILTLLTMCYYIEDPVGVASAPKRRPWRVEHAHPGHHAHARTPCMYRTLHSTCTCLRAWRSSSSSWLCGKPADQLTCSALCVMSCTTDIRHPSYSIGLSMNCDL